MFGCIWSMLGIYLSAQASVIWLWVAYVGCICGYTAICSLGVDTVCWMNAFAYSHVLLPGCRWYLINRCMKTEARVVWVYMEYSGCMYICICECRGFCYICVGDI